MKNGKRWLPLLAALGMLTACNQGSLPSVKTADDGTQDVLVVVQCSQIRGGILVNKDGTLKGFQPKEAHDIMQKYMGVLPDSQTMAAQIPCAPPEEAQPTAHHQGETNI